MKHKFKRGDFVICQKIENAFNIDFSKDHEYKPFINALCKITRIIPNREKNKFGKSLSIHTYYDYDIKIIGKRGFSCAVHEKNLLKAPNNLTTDKKKLSKIVKLLDI